MERALVKYSASILTLTLSPRVMLHVFGFIGLLALSVTVLAGPREQARRIHDRIAGVPPSETVLADMQADIVAGDAMAAAYTAMDNPAFYNVTLKNLAMPWTNRAQTVFAPLNDYVATFIGMVRDDLPFNTALSADILYIGSGVPAYANDNNAHYQALEDQGANLQAILQQTTQSAVTGLPANATAGLMTTRAAAEAFFIDGTNRAMLRFNLLNHLCDDLEQLKDITLPPDRIRQDVSRSPGGDSRIFLNNCIGCHTGMDPLAQAFAYYDFDNESQQLMYTPGQVNPKYGINSATFSYGFITPDDSWDNYWREGQNALLGWDDNLPGSGSGAKSMGLELGNSQAFAECQVKKVFKSVCFREPADAQDRDEITNITDSFINSNYQMKRVFAETAEYCMGE